LNIDLNWVLQEGVALARLLPRNQKQSIQLRRCIFSQTYLETLYRAGIRDF